MPPISPEYWQKLESLFHVAAQMDPAARAEYMSVACAGDDGLRREVEALLAASDEPDQILDGVVAQEAAAAVAGVGTGERIGQYEIVRELGHGGMGTVYLAVRADDQFRMQVAIKLARGDRMRPSTMERFLRERQILANLEHPGIARLLDGGTTVAGSPYVVMEYVNGVPVDVYCDRKQLSIRERIVLFCRIADAVSYAHRNLVVHRDIKPENVLVTASGDPKLLDFGIAKLLKADDGTPDAEGLTFAAERLMTPEYASPEQARGDAITTLSDVYSLGVLLYKILTEHVPVRITSVRSTEIERAICETAPQPPSVAARATPAWGKLGRESADDLDTILLVALHKEPVRRYASVENFAADLRRFLDGFPVLARGDSWGYRTGKLVRRHPVVSVSATLILIFIVVVAVSMAVLAKRARDEARMANEVTDFLVSVFQANDPSSGRGDKVTARELLDRGAVQLETRLKENPAVQARLFDTMGALYNDLGSSQKAEELLRRSLEVRREHLSLTDDAAADTLDNLGDVALDLSRYAEAERYYRKALAIHRSRTGDNDTHVAQDEARISSVLWNMGRFPEAEALDRSAIAVQTKLAGEDDLIALDMGNDLGTIFQSEGRYDEAAAQAKKVLDRRLRIEPPNHPDLGYSWHNYASPLASLGRYSESVAAERQALAVRIASYGENHPQVALTEAELAGKLVLTGEFDEALRFSQHALASDLKTIGPENRDTSFCYANDARALLATGDGVHALTQIETAVHTFEKIFPAGHPKTADTMEILAEVNFALGNRSIAAQELRKVIEVRTAAYGAKHPLVGSGQRLLAEVLAEEGQLAEAETLATSALAIARATYPKGHPAVGLAESALGWIDLKERHADAALPLLVDALDQAGKAYGPRHPRTASMGMRLAKAMAQDGNMQGALQLASVEAPILLQSKDPEWHQERALAEKVQKAGGRALLQ